MLIVSPYVAQEARKVSSTLNHQYHYHPYVEVGTPKSRGYSGGSTATESKVVLGR